MRPAAATAEPVTGLVRYDAMCYAIAECRKVDEVVELRNKAKALEVYAKQAMNLDAERQAAEVRIRAERRAGELLKEMKETGQRAAQKDSLRPVVAARDHKAAPQTLKDLGISKDKSSTWQKLAEVPKKQFEEALASEARPTTDGILAAAGKIPDTPKRHLDRDALWAYGRITDFESIIARPLPELVALMPDFQREHLAVFVPKLIRWLKEMK